MPMQKGGIFGLQIPNRVVPFVETIKFHLSSTVGCKFLGMLPISLIWASFPCVCYLSSLVRALSPHAQASALYHRYQPLWPG